MAVTPNNPPSQLKMMRKRNPITDERQAVKAYERFHGLQPVQVTSSEMDWPPPEELEEEFGPFYHPPAVQALLGELVALGYEDAKTLFDEEIEFGKPLPFLTIDWGNVGEEELYIIGGNYRVRLKPDFICGPLIYVEYRTVKSFDDSVPVTYKHRFQEPYPTLAHNYRGDQLYILRGESEFFLDRSYPVSAGIDG